MITTTRSIGRFLNFTLNTSNSVVAHNTLQSTRNLTIWYPDAKFEREFKVNNY